jgi:hypothetical protein
MLWHEFTLNNIKLFEKVKININNNNVLLHFLKMERSRINSFIEKNKNMYIELKLLKKNNNIYNKIKLYSDVDWVDITNVLDDLSNLPNIYKFTWKTPHDNINNIDNIDNIMYIQTTDEQINKIVKRIKILIFINEYIKYKTNNTNKISTIFLVLTNLKRFFPNKNELIRVNHVNGGYSNSYKKIIFVWRYEEFEKVLLHEIIHYFNMDNRDIIINTKLKINGPHSYYEAITDFWAIIYHLIYLSLIKKVAIKNLLELELTFIKNQAMILNDYFKLGNWDNIENISIEQSTPAFSYYILKYLLFEYFLINDLNKYINDLNKIKKYDKIIKEIIKIGFIKQTYINIKSSRMSLLQLN